MLCQELEFNGVIKQHGLDETKVTDAYHKAVIEALKDLIAKGYGAERKYDGTRVLAINEDGTITLQNRHGIPYTIRLPEIVKALQRFHGTCILDSEVVYLDPKTGEEKFTPCQRRCSTQYPDPFLIQQYPVTMEVFDILKAGGIDLEKTSYRSRKERLHELFSDEDDVLIENLDPALQYVPFETDLLKAWKTVIRKNREGLIVKQFDSPYEEGDRSYKWLKVKNWRFICCKIVGFTAGENARRPFFGSLVLAKDGKYVGCAGSGFNEWELRKFKDMFSDTPRVPNPFSYAQVGEPYTVVQTDVEVLVKFYQVTDTGVLRFPIFINA
jgi:ATP-dependent DNA ligase